MAKKKFLIDETDIMDPVAEKPVEEPIKLAEKPVAEPIKEEKKEEDVKLEAEPVKERKPRAKKSDEKAERPFEMRTVKVNSATYKALNNVSKPVRGGKKQHTIRLTGHAEEYLNRAVEESGRTETDFIQRLFEELYRDYE